MTLPCDIWSRDIRIETGYRLGRPGLKFRQRHDFSLLHNIQTGPGAHAASHPMVTSGSFPGDKAAGVWSCLLASI
jgi:hypothetical protein